MSIAEAPARQLTIQEWHEQYRDYQGRCELVRGRAIMTPTDAFRNIGAARRIERILEDELMPAWEPYHNASVLLRDDPLPTVRIPDLLLARGDVDPSRWLAHAADVTLVVEVVSPSSVETDWVAKGAEYAAAGIPHYLIVDVRDTAAPRLWLFDRLLPAGSSADTTYRSYADPTDDGHSVTLRIAGRDPITITAADLV